MKIFDIQLFKGTFIDSVSGNVATNTNGVFKRLEKGLAWYAYGINGKLALGNIGTVKTLVLWVRLKTISEEIAECNAGSNPIVASSGTLSYTGFDNAYINEVDTDTIANGWNHIVITGTTGVTAAAMSLGLNGSNYGDVAFARAIGYDSVISDSERGDLYRSFLNLYPMAEPKRLVYPKPTDLSYEEGLVAAYEYNESSNNTDVSGNGNNDATTGTILTLDGRKYDGLKDKSAIGNIGNIKTIAMRIKLASTTEKMIEGSAGGLSIFANAGTLSYADYDNAFINGVDTDIIAAGVWQTVVITSSTNVNNTAATLGLNGSTYGKFEIAELRFYSDEKSSSWITNYHNSFAKRIALQEHFLYCGVGNIPDDWIVRTGAFSVQEDSNGKYLQCDSDGSIKLPGINLYDKLLDSVDLSGGYLLANENGLVANMATGNTLRNVLYRDGIIQNDKDAIFTLTSTGDGSGVSTLVLTVNSDITLSLDGTARFYSDSGGTADESTTWVVTSGATRTRYIKCPSGTANLKFSDRAKVTQWNEWTSNVNAASLGGYIFKLTSLTYLLITGSNTLSGSVTGLTSLTYLFVIGSNTLSGDISELTSLTKLYVNGSNTLSGSVTGLTSLIELVVGGFNTLSGDINPIVNGPSKLRLTGRNHMDTYTAGAVWTNAEVIINPYTGYGYDSTEIDNMLIDMDNSGFNNKVITLIGSNAPRTSASDAAVNNLVINGCTVNTNP